MVDVKLFIIPECKRKVRFSLWMASIKQTAIIDTDVDWTLSHDSSHCSNSLFSWSMTILGYPPTKFHQCIVLSDQLCLFVCFALSLNASTQMMLAKPFCVGKTLLCLLIHVIFTNQRTGLASLISERVFIVVIVITVKKQLSFIPNSSGPICTPGGLVTCQVNEE